ncbi:MAG: 2'-5' RNA ligase family protein [Niabella sp.]
MNTTTTVTHLSIAKYVLLIHPRKDLGEKINQLKLNFCKKYKMPERITRMPSITLVSFTQYIGFEERIKNKLRSLSISQAPFPIEMQDYGSLPSHTIYINILSRPAIQSLAKLIRAETQQFMKLDNDHKPYFMMDPVIPIAQRLKPWQYEQAWLEYSHRSFQGKFIANNMLLLSKKTDEEKYKWVECFEFQDIPILPKQAVLF